jgi:hypothetical protein
MILFSAQSVVLDKTFPRQVAAHLELFPHKQFKQEMNQKREVPPHKLWMLIPLIASHFK